MRRFIPLLGLGLLACDPSTTTTPSATPPAPEPLVSTATTTPTAPTASATPTADAMLPEKPANIAPAALDELAQSQNDFGFALFHQLDPEGNAAMSPASIGMALGMTYMGARGETAAEMSKTLRLAQELSTLEKGYATVLHEWQSPGVDKVVLRVANRIFPEKTLEVDGRFRDLTRRGFGAPFELLDFKNAPEPARQHINDWVEKQTNERIVDLLPPQSIDAETRMVLANAIYFKAPWTEPFPESATAPAAFWVDGTTEKKVPTMRRTDHLLHAKVDGLSIVELPFAGDRFALDVILPDAKNGLAAAERILSSTNWARWMKALQSKRVAIALPKYRVEPAASLELKAPLQKLGINLAFDREKADFTGIANPPSPADRLFIGQVFHKAFVDVNEKGAEAAAATAVVMPRAGSAAQPEEPIAFTVDHPFLFAIRDTKTGMILFLGRVTDPKAPEAK